jgi:hypothetical protein
LCPLPSGARSCPPSYHALAWRRGKPAFKDYICRTMGRPAERFAGTEAGELATDELSSPARHPRIPRVAFQGMQSLTITAAAVIRLVTPGGHVFGAKDLPYTVASFTLVLITLLLIWLTPSRTRQVQGGIAENEHSAV